MPYSATPIGAAKGSSTLPRGAIAALAIGMTLVVTAIVGIIVFCMRRRRHINRRKRQMFVNPQLERARSGLSSLFPHKRRSETTEQKAHESGFVAAGVLDIRSPTPELHEKEESDESDDGEEGYVQRLSAAEKGKERALRRSNASKNSDGSYSIELPDLTIAQVPRGYLPASAVPSTPSPPRTLTLVPSVSSPTSPRSPGARPRGPRDLPGRESTRGILLSNMDSVPGPAQGDEEGQLAVPTPSYLPEAHISPLRVEFASDVQDRNGAERDRHISTGAVSLPQSLRQALSQQFSGESSAPPSPTRPNRIYSFLDFSSTSTSLARSQRQSASNSTGKSGSSSERSNSKRSKRNTGNSENMHSPHVSWATLPPDRRISLGLSMTLAGGSSTSRPNPNVSLHPVPLSQSTPTLPALTIAIGQATPPEPNTPEGEHQDFPYDANQLPSPTDSVPYTVSDIHFRHSTHSSIMSPVESRRASVAYRLSGSHRPPHPPLPSAGPSSPTRPTHRRGGSQAGSQTVPPFIVQRILGRTTGPSPLLTPQLSGMAAAATRSTTPTTSGTLPRASQPPSTGPPSTPAPPPTPGSSSVFGFQLGRHR